MRRDSLIQWLRIVLCAAVIAIWVICLTILGVACWVRDNLNPIIIAAEGTAIGNFYIHSFFPIVFPILITASCLMLVIGCVGCCGTCSNNKILLGWFFISTLVSLCVEISSTIGGDWGWDTGADKLDVEYLYEKLNSKEWQSTKWINHAWKEIQIKFNCCDIHTTDESQTYYEAISASTCLDAGGQQPCEESLIIFLTDTKVLKALPLLAVTLGILQFVALVITAKLWLLTCVTERLKESNAIRNGMQDEKVVKSNTQLKPFLKNTPVQTSQSSTTQIQSCNERLAKKLPAFASNQRDYNERCPQCVMKWYEETKLMTRSRLEAEYRELQVRSNRSNRRGNSRHYGELLRTGSSSTGVGLRSITSHPYHNHELIKSASYNSPTDWKTPSLQSVVKRSRHCYSASLPRRKQTHVRRHRRLHYPHNFIQRLSTIRASGVAAECDTSSSGAQESGHEELGDSRCYNTEAGSSSSGDKELFVRYERTRKISEPPGTGCSLYREYRSDYTTL